MPREINNEETPRANDQQCPSMESPKTQTVDLAEGIETVRRAFDFIGSLIELNSAMLTSLPPSTRTTTGKAAPNDWRRALLKAFGHTANIHDHGCTIVEAAKMLGVDRTTLSGHLVDIPNGPAPTLPVGKIPCRKIGKSRRIFEQDLFGTLEERIERNDNIKNETSGAKHEDYWRRQINNIRLGKHLEG